MPIGSGVSRGTSLTGSASRDGARADHHVTVVERRRLPCRHGEHVSVEVEPHLAP
jgi:hypothetical protein